MIEVFALMLLSGLSAEDQVQLTGEVEVDNQGSVMLSLTLRNDSDSAICFEDWFPLRHTAIDVTYADLFVVTDADGDAVRYQSKIADVDPKAANRQVYMLRVGEVAEALVNLSSLCELGKGSFTVTYLLSALPCSEYAKQNAYLTSPNNLKHLFLSDKLELVSEVESIVVLKPISFDVSGP